MIFQHLIDNLQFISANIRLQDFVDMFLVWLVVYQVLLLIKKTGTLQMLSGLGVLAIGYILSIWMELYTFNWILEKFFSNLFIIVVILFQAEIRRALAHIGSNPFFTDVSSAQDTQDIEEIAKGIVATSQRGYGALVVVERDIMIDYHIEVGIELDSKVSSDIIISVFHPSSPIHDGALIIRNGKIHSAGSILPLSKNPALDKNLGTRHRAAIGLTEETDSVVFVVSEENKSISIVQGGQLSPNCDLGDIRKTLYDIYGLKYRAYQQSEV